MGAASDFFNDRQRVANFTDIGNYIIYNVYQAPAIATAAARRSVMESRLTSILQDKGNKVHAIDPDSTVHECVTKMQKLGIGALLVMNGSKLVGIISERDIIRELVKCNCEIGKAKVTDIMTSELVTVPPTMTVTEAMRLVTNKRFRHLPVVENGELIGLVSIGDLTRWAMLAQEHEISSLTKYIHGDH